MDRVAERWRYWAASALTLLSGGVAYSNLVIGKDPDPAVAFVVIAVTAVGLAVNVLVSRVDKSAQLAAEARERLREAEQEVESALRAQEDERLERLGVVSQLYHLHPRGGDVNITVLPQPGAPAEEGVDGEPAGAAPRVAAGEAEEEDVSATARLPVRLALPELWKATHTRLEVYHDLATKHATRSFWTAQGAMTVGFLLLIAFVWIALKASTTAGAVVAGGLGAVAAALSGYVSRTFVRSQEAAASHLRAYFDQPLEFSRYLAAERLIAGSELSAEQRAEVVTELAKAMIAGPGDGGAGAKAASNGETGGAA
jgi:hypothetical protein